MKKHFILFTAILLTAVVIGSGTTDKDDDGFTNASLNGVYKKVLIEYDGNGISTSSLADMDFDGAGEVVANGLKSTSRSGGENLPFEGVGTYSVEPDGSFTFTSENESETVGQLHEDGKSYIVTKVDKDNSQMIVAAIKVGSSDYTNASFSGTFKRVGLIFKNRIVRTTIADITFNGNGYMHIEGVRSSPGSPGNVIPIDKGSRYIVEPDGSFTFGDSFTGQLHEDLKSYIVTQVDDNNTQMISIGFRTGKTGFSNASLKGVYRRVMFTFKNNVPVSSIADATFDGKGKVTIEGIRSSPDGDNQPFSNAFSYTVYHDGSLAFSDSQPLGQLHEDKNSYIMTGDGAIIIGTRIDKKEKEDK